MLRAKVPLALEAMVRMDEGDSSATNVTDTLLPDIAILGVSVTETLSTLVRGLVVFPEAMRRNLDLTRGLIVSEALMMRLTKLMGRHEAHQVLYEAAQRAQSEGLPFLRTISEHPLFKQHPLPEDWAQALDASAYVGESAALAVQTVTRVRP